jgi:hypothetical protein
VADNYGGAVQISANSGNAYNWDISSYQPLQSGQKIMWAQSPAGDQIWAGMALYSAQQSSPAPENWNPARWNLTVTGAKDCNQATDANRVKVDVWVGDVPHNGQAYSAVISLTATPL